MIAGSSSRTLPESDWLDSGAGWGCTPVLHWEINIHRSNQQSPDTHSGSSPRWQHGAPGHVSLWDMFSRLTHPNTYQCNQKHYPCLSDQDNVSVSDFIDVFVLFCVVTKLAAIYISRRHFSIPMNLLLYRVAVTDWMPGLSLWLTGQQPITDLKCFACVYVCQCHPLHSWSSL